MIKRFKYFPVSCNFLRFHIIDSDSGDMVKYYVDGVDLAIEICDRWNLQEYEGIDDTEGHL